MIGIWFRQSAGLFVPGVLCVLWVLSSSRAAWGDWSQFRGPAGNGHTSARRLPLEWSETKNIRWKTAIHGRAWSSPVTSGDRVWLTSASDDGRELFALAVSLTNGAIAFDQKLFDVANPQLAHKFNSYASPTPVIESNRVYVTFGSPGTACLDGRTGKVLWERRDFECNHYRGAGSSPIIHGNLLLMHFDGSDHQFVVALDKNSGKTAWRVNRSIDFKDLGPDGKPQAEGDFRKAFATPHVATIDGKPTLISIGAKATYGYDPVTGTELWRVEERTSHSGSTRPVVAQGLVIFPTGFSKGQLLAVRPGRRGEVIDANAETNAPATADRQLEVVWRSKRNVACKPSVLAVDDLIFMIDDGGVATCLEAKSGTQVWTERVGGNHSASPLYASASQRIYFFNEEGKTSVIEAGRQFRLLAENELAEGFMASPAVAGDALILRTKTHLYRVEE